MAAEYEKHHAPATARNREVILAVLQRVLPAAGTVVELASGSGEHAVYFAPRLAPRFWLPSDPDAHNRGSIKAWIADEPSPHLLPPLNIDATDDHWPVEDMTPPTPVSAIVVINMIHISPWQATLGLMAGAGRLLSPGDVLYTYGPYMRDEQHTAPSNANFNQWLKAQDPRWGVRDLAEVTDAANAQGLDLTEIVDMPANNLSLVFTKAC